MLKIHRTRTQTQASSLRLSFSGALKGSCILKISDLGLHGVTLESLSLADGMLMSRCDLNWVGNVLPTQALPRWMHAFLDEFQAYIKGGDYTFEEVPLVGSKPMSEFALSVYGVTSLIRPGDTMSYGGLAMRMEMPMAARAVGGALGRNPWPLIVPCHRVVGNGQQLVGFSAEGGIKTKATLLDFERLYKLADEDTHDYMVAPLHA